MGNRWATQPHIRFGDPCYRCGISMTPGGKLWRAHLRLPGWGTHGSHGLCTGCEWHWRTGKIITDENGELCET